MNPPKSCCLRIASRAGVPLLLFWSLSGCLPNRAYRIQLPPCPAGKDGPASPECSVQWVHPVTGTDIPVAFIEFDDVGQAFQPKQMAAAEEAIREEKHKHGQIVTVVFVHGWKNNASDDSGNVPGFRRILQRFQPQLGGAGLVGVYFGWRGGTTNIPVVKEFTYWNRRDTATYIPGSNMSEALLRIARAVKGADYSEPSKLVVVGHSFGGLVLERTITQYLTRRVIENPSGNLFADLLVFVNEAAAATEAIQLLTMFHDRLKPQADPTIVSITSQGDMATKFVLPVGQGASLFKKSLRTYGGPNAPDPFGIVNQRSYYVRSATHIPELESHIVAKDSPQIRAAYTACDSELDPTCGTCDPERDPQCKPRKLGYTCAAIPSPGGGTVNYYMVRIRAAKNTTPYWIMQMPVEIVPDHSNVFRPEFGDLLSSFVRRRVAEEQPGAATCQFTEPPNLHLMRNTLSVK